MPQTPPNRTNAVLFYIRFPLIGITCPSWILEQRPAGDQVGG